MKKNLLTLVAVNSLLIAVSFPVKAQYDTIHNFNGIAGGTPQYGSLINISGVLYGMAETGGANNHGCIFSINPDGTGYTDLLDFNNTTSPQGAMPEGSLIYSATTNKLYGMTEAGGVNGDGCIFSIHPDGTGYTDIKDFAGGGTTNGANPNGALILAGNKLYGMTEDGGLNSEGNIFSIDTGGGAYKDIYDMNSFISGQFPFGSLTLSVTGDTLFGMTSQSGPTSGDGVLFSIDTSGSAFTDMVNFTGTNGNYPVGSLVLGGNVLYGMTSAGGTNGMGNIFSIPTDGSTPTNIYSFPSSGGDGKAPYGDLILSGKILYGMTSGGGVNLEGNIFKIDTTGAGFVDMVDLGGTTTPGVSPYGSLLLAGAKLYGFTSVGGTDSKGVIFSEDLISVSTTDTGVSCNGNSNGHATAYITGGTGPFTYNWTLSGGANRTATGLSAGAYTITVTDNTGLTATNTVVITEPAVLTATTSFTQASCNLSNGSATATVTGGTSPYTYLWNDASFQTTPTANNLSAGTYIVDIADMNGCTTSATVTVTQPSAVTASISGQTNVTCNGGANGTASASVTGGSTPYTYDWSAGNATTTGVSSLGAGIYTLTVTDNSGCSSTITVNITEPNSLTTSATETANVSCVGGDNGSAMAIPSGGTAPYTYLWNDASSQATATATGLTVGSYTVTITDACGGDIATATVGISQPPSLGVSAHETISVTCLGGDNGAATATPTGGASPYTYLWSAGSQTTPTATGLAAGNYTVTITDACGGESATAVVTISQPAPIGVSAITTSNVSCHDGDNGSTSSTVTGGTAPFTYSWTGGAGNAASASGLGVGTYTLTVNDACGDGPVSTTVVITQPASALVADTLYTTMDSDADCVASAMVTVSGGTPPYTYAWTSGSTTDSVYNQCGDATDTCYVTDANGCVTSVFITFQSLGINNIGNPYNVTIYPDPNKGIFTISINNGQTENKDIEIYNSIGQKVYSSSYQLLSNGYKPLTINLSSQPNGIYLIRIVNTDGTLVTEKKMIKAE